MSMRRLIKWISDLGIPGLRQRRRGQAHHRGQMTHVLILDGTMSTLAEGFESNAGLTYKLLDEIGGPSLSIYYEAGLQWQDWRSTRDIITGGGLNRQIRRAYGYLASRYRPGDRIFLFGYSRGAFAVRSLAGAIDKVGLLRADHATERNVNLAYRHYRSINPNGAMSEFREAYCHETVEIEMIGVWDTVKALGWRLPILWRFKEDSHAFHNHALSPVVRHGYHALALDETRAAFEPVMWHAPEGGKGRVEQVWFRGTHGDVGGHLGNFHEARPLSNIPLVWMLEKAEACGLALPGEWHKRFACDPEAPSVGRWRGWGKLFVIRRERVVGADPSEHLHPSVRHDDPHLTTPQRVV
ncbi:DUF2235 domain-containing protein [Roseovarius nubinhibens]|uniref:DUF2235 domain-containing protein n=1 Tax=Roseovarius nubinhibens TaxID=314263 RepID=UPI001C09AB05|nr:DUF2235 domain-containing protein [Roseovarius nubinhibens]MBU3000134.1 DUF2235 domain-containing protein [Roseovarius nubinhibens]